MVMVYRVFYHGIYHKANTGCHISILGNHAPHSTLPNKLRHIRLYNRLPIAFGEQFRRSSASSKLPIPYVNSPKCATTSLSFTSIFTADCTVSKSNKHY